MGITKPTLDLITQLGLNTPHTVLELGCQVFYLEHMQQICAKPYLEQWYGWNILSIDLTGCEGSTVMDLREPQPWLKDRFTLCTNFGCISYVDDRKGFWQAYKTVHEALKIGGIAVHRTPETGSWPEMTFKFLDLGFYRNLAKHMDYETMLLERQPGAGNDIDGWEVVACLKKTSDKEFVPFELFDGFGVYDE